MFGTHSGCCFFDLLFVLVGRHASRVIDFVARKEPRGVVDVQVGGLGSWECLGESPQDTKDFSPT